jgi:hypothetical protein
VLSPQQTPASRACLALSLSNASVAHLQQRELEQMRQTIPVARSLPLLELLAQGRNGSVVVEYLDTLGLSIEVSNLA